MYINQRRGNPFRRTFFFNAMQRIDRKTSLNVYYVFDKLAKKHLSTLRSKYDSGVKICTDGCIKTTYTLDFDLHLVFRMPLRVITSVNALQWRSVSRLYMW